MRQPSFGGARLAMASIFDFQVRLDETELPNCVKGIEVASSLPFTRTGGQYGLRLREKTSCVVWLQLSETRLSSLHFSATVKSWVR